jgi:hypothetical protein
MAAAAQFNDPFESRPQVAPIPGTPKEASRAYRKKLASVLRERSQTYKEVLRHQLLNQRRFEQAAERLPEIVASAIERFRHHPLIVSLSSDGLRPLMWSHYADSHRGLCLHLNGGLAPWFVAQPVHYSRTFPAIEVPVPPERNAELIEKTLLYKDEDWSYEQEFRVLGPIDDEDENNRSLRAYGVTFDREWMTVPPETVTGITLGAEMPVATRQELIAEIRAARPSFTFKQARLSNSSFAIETDDVT